MKQLFNRYEVIDMRSFYHTMVGKLVHESPRTVVLEFKLNENLGGLQRVQFFKSQVEYRGEF